MMSISNSFTHERGSIRAGEFNGDVFLCQACEERGYQQRT